jgi:MFS family permease
MGLNCPPEGSAQPGPPAPTAGSLFPGGNPGSVPPLAPGGFPPGGTQVPRSLLASLRALPARYPVHRGLLAALASLATSVHGFRPGTAVPGSNAPYRSAPSAPAARHRASAARVRASLRYSTLEGLFAELTLACAGGAVLTGYALYLGCGPFLVGLLGALPFLAQAVQIPAAWITATLGRRAVAVAAVSASRLILFPLALLPFLHLSPGGARAVLLGVGFASAILAVIGNNAWVTWMGDLVPDAVRGRYFGRRTAVCTVGATAGCIGSGVFLDLARSHSLEGEGLAALAAVAVIAGVISTWLMVRQHEPAADGGRSHHDLRGAAAPFRDPRVQAFLVYQVVWNASIGVSAPFFNVHMLGNLGMGFTAVALYSAAIAAVRILTAPLWGKALDAVGPRPVLVACSFGIATIPLVWLVPTPALLWPLALEPLLSGSLWAGHALAAFDLPLDLAPRKSRPAYLAAFAGIGGISFAVACTAGGLLADSLPARFELAGVPVYALHVLFVLSAVGRLGGAVLGLRITAAGSRPIADLFHLAGDRLSRATRATADRLGLTRPAVPRPEPTDPVRRAA